MAGSACEKRRKKKRHHRSRWKRSYSRRGSGSCPTCPTPSNEFEPSNERRAGRRRSCEITPNDGSAREEACMERREISTDKFAMNKKDPITDADNETEELRKRFNDSLKKAMNQLSYHLVKGENSEKEEEDEPVASVQQKTVQEVIACTSRVLFQDERIDPVSVEIQMRINNIRGRTVGRRANVHFNAFAAKGVDERGGKIIRYTKTIE
ncbi:hypothetical protein Tcan_11421 [Toxocara canis]|uniref:Uncharacterized protein n=1 Tax=Toxocara canis TaxID=6265 RepID=A0A0B2VMC1_TOXCA|nr:hypothetical protein Tcan_11421 [Toxocara canis]